MLEVLTIILKGDMLNKRLMNIPATMSQLSGISRPGKVKDWTNTITYFNSIVKPASHRK